ncbi:MAG: hypothetical protein PHH13_05305 [Candidatus Peribacteraceae bacterium]|nr:hypothetical protein [Candidatus Peribacteraceae bacterium]
MPPNQPNPSGTSPELQRELEAIWQREVTLAAGTKISADTQKKLHTLFGKGRTAELLPGRKPEAAQIQAVHQLLAQTRTGLLPIIHENDAKKRAAQILPYTGGNKKLNELVADPESPEAELLAYLHLQHVNPTDAAMLARFSALYKPVTLEELTNATNLLKAKELYDKLIADDENLSLSARITQKESLATTYQGRAATGKAKTAVQFLEAESKQREEADKLGRRRASLVKSLKIMDGYLKQLIPPGGWPDDPEILAAAGTLENAFNSTAPVSFVNSTVSLRTTGHSISGWMRDDSLKSTVETVTTRYRFRGSGNRPPASVVLDAFLREQFGSGLIAMPETDKERFYQELKTILLSGVAAPAAAGVAPAAPAAPSGSTAPRGASSGATGKTESRSWRFIRNFFSPPS